MTSWLRRTTIGVALTLGAVFGAAVGFGGGVPNMLPSPTFSEPSQIVGTINTVINQLNGNAGYAPAQLVSLGSFGTASSGSPVTLNTQRGVATFTGVGTIADGATVTVTLTNSLISAASVCNANITADGSAGASAPYIRSLVPTAGSLAIALSNGSATATGAAATYGIGFNCVN